jgi:hypothetical protein
MWQVPQLRMKSALPRFSTSVKLSKSACADAARARPSSYWDWYDTMDRMNWASAFPIRGSVIWRSPKARVKSVG